MKLLLVILLIFFDFLTKKIVFHYIELNNSIFIIPFIDIVHIHNYGISFGLFANILPAGFIIFLGIIIIIFLFFWMYTTNNKFEKLGLLLIITGAISNIGDRAINNYVMDFIYLHYNQFYWPAFNFADIYISVGIVLMIISSFKSLKTRVKAKND